MVTFVLWAVRPLQHGTVRTCAWPLLQAWRWCYNAIQCTCNWKSRRMRKEMRHACWAALKHMAGLFIDTWPWRHSLVPQFDDNQRTEWMQNSQEPYDSNDFPEVLETFWNPVPRRCFSVAGSLGRDRSANPLTYSSGYDSFSDGYDVWLRDRVSAEQWSWHQSRHGFKFKYTRIVEGLFFVWAAGFEIPFQRSVSKTCKYASFTDESILRPHDLMSWYLRTAMAMTWATTDLTVLAAMARRLGRQLRFSQNLLGQLLQLPGSQDEHRRRFGVCLPRFAVICLTDLSKENP